MDIETRKRLIEKLLDECWHELEEKGGYYSSRGNYGDPSKEHYVDKYFICKNCHKVSVANRTFTTPVDALDVMNKLVEMGKWQEFYFGYAFPRFYNEGGSEAKNAYDNGDSSALTAWLFSPDASGVYRICSLAGEFVKEVGEEIWRLRRICSHNREKKKEGKSMKDEGWSFGDLAGELWVRGIDIYDVDQFTVYDACLLNTPEMAANYIERQEATDGR